MGRFQIVGDSAASATLATTAVIPVLNGAVTGTGDATAAMVTLADLSTFFLTVDGPFTTTTATATPSTLSATQFTGFASAVSGAGVMGYGSTRDFTVFNQAGTVVIGVTANTTGVTMAGALAMTGALSGVTTLAGSGAISGFTTLALSAGISGVTTIAMSGALSGGTTITVSSSIRSTGPTGGIGYSTGAGGAQTQATSKATTVVSNTITTAITMNGAELALLAIVAFTFTNSTIAATDTVICTHESAGTSGAYLINAFPGAGSAIVSVRNNTAGNLSEAIVLRITVIKSVSA